MTTGEPLDKQLNLRVSTTEMDRIDRVATLLSQKMAGVSVNRSAAARAAIIKGLEALEADLKKPSKK
jgi:hypothetical protein